MCFCGNFEIAGVASVEVCLEWLGLGPCGSLSIIAGLSSRRSQAVMLGFGLSRSLSETAGGVSVEVCLKLLGFVRRDVYIAVW